MMYMDIKKRRIVCRLQKYKFTVYTLVTKCTLKSYRKVYTGCKDLYPAIPFFGAFCHYVNFTILKFALYSASFDTHTPNVVNFFYPYVLHDPARHDLRARGHLLKTIFFIIFPISLHSLALIYTIQYSR
jgi:hypothetical protein